MFAAGIGEAKCAVFQSDLGTVLYPFVHRKIEYRVPNGEHLTDIISPYGYGGYFAWDVTDSDALLKEFVSRLDGWSVSQGVISEFVRMSLFPMHLLGYPEPLTERSSNVVRSLDLSEEELWRDYDAKVRKNVKKALRNGVRVEVDDAGSSLEAFHRIFASTMDRRDASSSYRYSMEFFQDLTSCLKGHIAYVNAIHEEQVVSTELVLISAHSVYSFLGGTLSSAFDVRPNDLLKHELCLWAKGMDKEFYVLGGGYQKDDGIFRYKKSFAPTGIVPFYTGERVLDPARYDALVDVKEQQRLKSESAEPLDRSFFPLYRAP
jgi:hypothetical protein